MNRRRVRRYNYMISEINAIYHDLAVRTGLSDSAQSVLYAICESGEKCLQSDISVSYTHLTLPTTSLV